MSRLRGPLLALLVLGLPGIGQARTETLRWTDPNPAPSPVESFEAHHGPSSGNYDTVVDLGLPVPDGAGVYTFNITVPDPAVIFIALRASDPPIVSGFSNEQVRLPNQAPESTIDDPSGDPAPISAGQSVFFAGSGTDPDGDLPLTYSWDFQQAQSGVPPSTLLNPGSTTFSQIGSFTVTFTVTDSLGLPDPTPDTVVITVVTPGQPPESSIDAPTGPVTIDSGESVDFAGSGTDPDGDLPLTYHWDFQEAQSGVAPTTSQIPGSITFSQSFTVSS